VATAPYQLWLDIAPIASAIRVASTVTVTTSSAHGLVTGAYVEMQSAADTPGTSMNGAYSVTVTSGTTFTYSAAGSAGTATVVAAAISVDLLNPPINYAAASRQSCLYVAPDSMHMSASGDGSGSSLQFSVMQDDTPSDGPWFTLIPDESRVRLVKANTGTTPASDKSDLLFVSTVRNIAAKMNGSGQGTITDVDLADPTSVLDRLAVYGAVKSARFITVGGISRTSNVATVTTQGAHGFTDNDRLTISNVTGGGATTFNGNIRITGVPSTTTFTYANTGANATGNTSLSISSAAFNNRSKNQVILTFASATNLQTNGASVSVSGLTSASAEVQNLVNGVFQNCSVNNTNRTVFITLPKSVSATAAITATSGTLIGLATATPPANNNASSKQRLTTGETDVTTVKRMLSIVNQNKADDYALQRVLNTSDQTKIVGSTTELNKADISIAPTTLRSTIDTVIETFSGQDGKERRYWVNGAGQLNYTLTDVTARPTYATAPYKIITTGAGTPNTTTGAATVAPFSLNVNYDHNTTKSAVFNVPGDIVTLPTVRTYINAGYTERKNAPKFDAAVDYDGAASDAAIQLDRTAKSFFLEAHKPMLSIELTLRGAGTAAHNLLGFNAGYAQTGASSYALVNSWQPGQWVDITCAELGLSGLYRVESVDWSLERGSFQQAITITANRRPVGSLTTLVQKIGKGKS
jgi:hypothetical protein